MRLTPGTWPWLLRHELRLGWRAWSDSASLLFLMVLLGWLVLHIPGFFLMRNVSLAALMESGMAVAGMVVWFGLTLMLSTAVILSVNALFDRGDFDLLISSPLPTSTIFTVRGIGVALSSVALFVVLVSPFAHAGIAYGQFGLIAVYPVLLCLGLGITGVAFALTLLLVRWFGARRARVLAQVLGAVIGASLFLAFQTQNLVPDAVRERWLVSLGAWLDSPWLDDASPLWWPARALFGDPLPLVAVVAAGVVLFVVVVRATSRAFLAGTQEPVSSPARRKGPDGPGVFRQGLVRNVLNKEIRLILRDSNLLAKTLLQGLYLLPLGLLLARNNEVILIVGPITIMLLGSMAGNLAWITIAAEEAPELVGSAPVSREKVRWLKAAAALQPLVFVAAPFVLFYLWKAPAVVPAYVLFLAFGLAVPAVIQVFGSKPSPERDLKRRQKENVGLNLLEVLSTLAIAGACYLGMTGSWWALAVLPLGLLGPAAAWGMRPRDAI
jgi:ABC-2 type transport system permease protein